MPRVFFKTSNPISLVKSCCHSDSLTGWEERSLSLDVVNISWLSEWGNVTAETYDSLHYIPRPTFPGTWNSTSAEFLFCQGAHFSWLKHILLGSFGCEGEAPHQPDFHNVIILVDLCIRHKICSSVCVLVWEMQINWMCNRINFVSTSYFLSVYGRYRVLHYGLEQFRGNIWYNEGWRLCASTMPGKFDKTDLLNFLWKTLKSSIMGFGLYTYVWRKQTPIYCSYKNISKQF